MEKAFSGLCPKRKTAVDMEAEELETIDPVSEYLSGDTSTKN